MKTTLMFWTLTLTLLSACSKNDGFYKKDPIPAIELKQEEVPLVAQGVAVEEDVVDEFEQKSNANREIDILWVVDNSRSMQDEQAALAKNFSAFINEFVNNDVNFRMAVTVTDPDPSWKGYMIRNNPNLLTSASLKKDPAKFIEEFKTTIKVGIAGSGNEQGLNAIEGFIERYSETFIRKSAYLMVVIVSDEEDSSPKAVSQYVKELQAIKQNHGLLKVYSIVDTKNVRSVPGQSLKHGFSRYKEMSNATSGMVVDINQDFHKSLTTIGKSVIELLNNFPLKAQPLENSLRVYVNEELSLEENYSVSSDSHVLKFIPEAVPASGATIRAEYKIKR